MMSKLPLYISAIALFIAVVGTLFLFNNIQKMKKSLIASNRDKGAIPQLDNKVDVIADKMVTLAERLFRLEKALKPKEVCEPQKKTPETLVVDEDEDIEVESVTSLTEEDN